MPKIKDISGQRFGKLICKQYAGKDKNNLSMFLCKCDCGNETICRSGDLISSKTKSCGCKKHKLAHGLSRKNGRKIPLYGVWVAMRQRCNNKNNNAYKHYGGRGISVCDEWNDFERFYNWAMINGYKKKLSIERINNDGNYEPANCKWIPMSRQIYNRRISKYLTIDGETKTVGEWARIYGIDRRTLSSRIEKGWSVKKAINEPIAKRR